MSVSNLCETNQLISRWLQKQQWFVVAHISWGLADLAWAGMSDTAYHYRPVALLEMLCFRLWWLEGLCPRELFGARRLVRLVSRWLAARTTRQKVEMHKEGLSWQMARFYLILFIQTRHSTYPKMKGQGDVYHTSIYGRNSRMTWKKIPR